MAKTKLVLFILSSFFLAACGDKNYELEGRYYLAIGDDCSVPTNEKDKNSLALEIIPKFKNGEKRYAAKMPLAVMLGMPISSVEDVSPSKKGDLYFEFSKPEEHGFASSSKGINMTVSVSPYENRDGYILIKSVDLIYSMNGKVNEVKALENFNKISPGTLGSKGLCLRKS